MSCLTVAVVIAVACSTDRAHSQPAVNETVASHIKGLQDPDANVRSSAARSLETLGKQAAPAVAALVQALSDTEMIVRRNAAAALGSIGPDAKQAASSLTDYLEREDHPYGRQAALEALERIAPTSVTNVPSLITGLKSADKARRRWSAEALARLEGTAMPALSELTAALKDSEPIVRAAAAGALQNLREGARPAIGALLTALQDDHADVRANAAEALIYIGPGTEDAVPQLIKALDDSDERVRGHAARAFLNDWAGAERAVPTLIKALDDPDSSFGAPINAGYALKHLAKRGHSQLVVPALVEYLKQPSKTGESVTIRTLGDIGSEAKAAIPAIEERVKSSDSALRGAAAVALSRIGGKPDESVRALIADLYNDDAEAREKAIRSLGDIGPAASAAVPELIALLADSNQQAFAAFKQAAEAGVAEAQFELALQFRDGIGTAPDIASTVAWLQKAADQGHAKAQRQLGILYRQGRGVPRDDKEAEKWYRRSTEPTSVAVRLENVNVSQEAYQAALESHRTGKSTYYGTNVNLILSITTFDANAIVTHHNQVSSVANHLAFREVYNHARQGSGSSRITPSEMTRLESLLKALPKGVEFVPLDQKLTLSCRVGNQWTTRDYDMESLPTVVRLLLDLVGAQPGAVPYPPQERLSWLAKSQPPLGVIYRPDGVLQSWGAERRVYHWKNGQLVDVDGIDRYPLRGRPVAATADRVVTKEAERLKLWDIKSGQLLADLGNSEDPNERSPHEANFSSDGKTLVVQKFQHHQVQVWDASTGRFRGELQAGGFYQLQMALSSDGKQLALSCADKTIRIWDLQTFQVKREIKGSEPRGMVFSPDGKSLAWLYQDSLTVWELATGQPRFKTQVDSWAAMPHFTPDGAMIIHGMYRQSIKLRDARDGRVLGIAQGHTGDITALAVSPDGQEIASSSEDGTIKLWNIEQLLRME